MLGMDNDVYVVSVGYNQVNKSYLKETIDYVDHFDSKDIIIALEKHQNWWRNYYSASSLSLPDKIYQRFYDMQLYKLASATRTNKPAIDLQGHMDERYSLACLLDELKYAIDIFSCFHVKPS